MKYMSAIITTTFALWFLVGCATPPITTPENEVENVTPNEGQPIADHGALSWEKNHAERKAWSDFTFGLLAGELFSSFDSAKDAKRICPRYENLTKAQKVRVWGELISAMAYFESGWKPTSRMIETTMGTDPVTGNQVASEGLMQLSYQDVPNYGSVLKYPACKIDWQKDKSLSVTDEKKTILDPYINLECGLRILANQIRKKGSVILSSGVYWAVIKDGGKYSKIEPIIAMVAKTGMCK